MKRTAFLRSLTGQQRATLAAELYDAPSTNGGPSTTDAPVATSALLAMADDLDVLAEAIENGGLAGPETLNPSELHRVLWRMRNRCQFALELADLNAEEDDDEAEASKPVVPS